MGCGINIFPPIVLTDYTEKVYAVDNFDLKIKSFEEILKEELKGKSLPIETIHANIEGFKSENGSVTATLYNVVKTGLPKADVVLFHRTKFLRFSEYAFKRPSQLFRLKLEVRSMHQLMKLGGYLLILTFLGELQNFYEIGKNELKGFSEVEKDLTSVRDAYLVMQKTE